MDLKDWRIEGRCCAMRLPYACMMVMQGQNSANVADNTAGWTNSGLLPGCSQQHAAPILSHV